LLTFKLQLLLHLQQYSVHLLELFLSFQNKEVDSEDAEMPHPSTLTDDDLKAALLKHGVKAGPIVGKAVFYPLSLFK